MQYKYTVILAVFNEEDRVELALRNFYKRANIVIIDNFSSDNTIEIAKKYTNEIYQYKNPGVWDVAFYKFALSKVNTDYVYFASAAEIVPLGVLGAFDLVAMGDSGFHAVACMRKSISSGIWTHRNWSNPERITHDAKFAKKDCFDFSKYRIHSERPLSIPRSEVLLLPANDENVIWQFRDYSVTVTESKHSIYGAIEAKQRFDGGERTSMLKIIILSIKEFLSSYLLDGGIKAGAIGFFTAVWRSQMRFNIQARVWEYQNHKTLDDIKGIHRKIKEEMVNTIELECLEHGKYK
jgi:glycosyltransferase involved in cell wall biosynthesis